MKELDHLYPDGCPKGSSIWWATDRNNKLVHHGISADYAEGIKDATDWMLSQNSYIRIVVNAKSLDGSELQIFDAKSSIMSALK